VIVVLEESVKRESKEGVVGKRKVEVIVKRLG
jgi:hypothetical protein